MNILFISATVPYPATDGGRIRVLNLLTQICKNNRVTFLALETLQTDRQGIEYLCSLGVDARLVERTPEMPRISFKVIAHSILRRKPLTVAKYYMPAMTTAIKQLLASQTFDVVHFEMLHTGQYLHTLSNLCVPTLLSLQNIDSSIWRRLAQQTDNPLQKLAYGTQARAFRRYEKIMAPKFTACACVSEEDKNLLAELCPNLDIEVIPNGVDVESYQPNHDLEEEAALVYTGSMDWRPNEDAVLYFHEQIFPLITSQIPQAKFYIVGQYPTERVQQLAQMDKTVIVTGMVDDVKPYIAKASVYIVPLRIGGGTRLKILEALAMEKAVVSTAIGCEGLQVIPDEEILVANEPAQFAELVVQLAQDKQRRRHLGQDGRRLVEEQYDWRSIGRKLNEFYEELFP